MDNGPDANLTAIGWMLCQIEVHGDTWRRLTHEEIEELAEQRDQLLHDIDPVLVVQALSEMLISVLHASGGSPAKQVLQRWQRDYIQGRVQFEENLRRREGHCEH